MTLWVSQRLHKVYQRGFYKGSLKGSSSVTVRVYIRDPGDISSLPHPQSFWMSSENALNPKPEKRLPLESHT